MNDITKIKVDGEPESSYQLYPRNEEFAKRAGGNGGSQSGVQPDWNQNDDTKPDYIKNRPFYTGDTVETVLLEESTASFTNPGASLYYAAIPTTIELTAGKTYKVSWDGTAYECVCESIMGYAVIGNPSIMGVGADTGDPFAITPLADNNGTEIYTLDTSASHTFSISEFAAAEVVKIPDKYISDTFRDIIIAGYPEEWSSDEWTKYYNLFQNGKLLKISGSKIDFNGYALSMTDYTARRILAITGKGDIYSSSVNSYTGDFYWVPIYTENYLYLRYLQTGSYADKYDREEYAILGAPSGELEFITKNHNENKVSRRVVLYGDGELVLKSSTENSAKKFKITVDDSGAITATEVT